MKNTNNIILIIILVVIVGAASFFGGMKYQQSKQPSRADFQNRMGLGDATGTQRLAGSQAARGEIIDKDDESITVKLPDNSSKIILISENTAINKATEGSIDDLKTGEQVMVFGKSNSDGSITATNIQLGSGFRPERVPEAN